jgi:VanZ family protein
MQLPRPSIAAFRVALCAALAVILYLATTEVTYPVVEDVNDKVSHVLAFAVLAFLGDFSFPDTRFALTKFTWLMMYGVLIETVQYFLPYRTASLLDLTADAVGLAAYWMFHVHLRRAPMLGRRWQ